MKVMVVGGGGREHALAWKISLSDEVEEVVCAPGNAGIAGVARCEPVKAEDIDGLMSLAEREKPGLMVIGPEAPLTMGLADRARAAGMAVFGASKEAAEIEGSKVFAKELMTRHGIPTAGFKVFTDASEARAYVESTDGRLVLKADGLAAGKGVIVCGSGDEALAAVSTILEDKAFGSAGDRLLIEDRLYGEEASFLAFTDGENVVPLEGSQDHKAIYDGDQGPNTGGMGAYTPAPVLTEALTKEVMDKVMVPTVRAMAAEGRRYRGVLYAGLMITDDGPMVLEFNARFGDPETQPLMYRMKSDVVELMLACDRDDGSLANMKIEWLGPTVCVVMAADGYPGSYGKGFEISGLLDAASLPETMVFHAGTAEKDGKIVTSGGRVLGVTARGPDIAKAIENAYRAAGKISWQGAYYRKDIGKKALAR